MRSSCVCCGDEAELFEVEWLCCRGERVHGDVVGACGNVCLESTDHVVCVSPCHQVVYDTIGSTIGEVALLVSERLEVMDVGGQVESGLHVGLSPLAGDIWVCPASR